MSFEPVAQAHFDLYAQRMAQSLPEKLFFAEAFGREGVEAIVDFGCADGALLASLSEVLPGVHRIGYDLSELAVARAAKRTSGAFFSDWDALEAHLAQLRAAGIRKIGLVASSVLHEVYAYGGETAGELFWSRLLDGPFTHFALRDMTISASEIGQNDGALRPALLSACRAAGCLDLLTQFEAHWGLVTTRERRTHFLLKYRYRENWARELGENYLPITLEGIQDRVATRFSIEMLDHARLPFLEEQARKDLGTGFPCSTHLKLIARKPH